MAPNTAARHDGSLPDASKCPGCSAIEREGAQPPASHSSSRCADEWRPQQVERLQVPVEASISDDESPLHSLIDSSSDEECKKDKCDSKQQRAKRVKSKRERQPVMTGRKPSNPWRPPR